MITPFTIETSDALLEDLRYRLAHTRFPDEVGTNWQYGTDLGYLKSLCDYWQHDFDWRTQEAKLNALPQFKTRIEDRQVHFVHQRSEREDAIPLLMTHGWPGSIAEFTTITVSYTHLRAHET